MASFCTGDRAQERHGKEESGAGQEASGGQEGGSGGGRRRRTAVGGEDEREPIDEPSSDEPPTEGEGGDGWAGWLLTSAGLLAAAAVCLRFAVRTPVFAALLGGSPLGALAFALAGASVGAVFLAATAGQPYILAGAAVLAGLGTWALSRAQEALEAAFKADAAREIAEACAAVADEAASLLSTTAAREFETNKIQSQVETTLANTGALRWRLSVQGRRNWFWQPWNVTFVEVARADPDEELPAQQAGKLPPQVRHWSSDTRPLRWEVVWQRGARYTIGK